MDHLADEGQRRVDDLEQLGEEPDVLHARAVVGEHERGLGAALGLLRLTLVLEHLRGRGRVMRGRVMGGRGDGASARHGVTHHALMQA